MKPVLLSARRAIQRVVRDPGGGPLGRLKDLAIDVSNGRTVYAIVAWKCDEKAEQQCYAIPWSSVQGCNSDGELVIRLSEETLRNAREVEDPATPTFPPHHWEQDIFDYYRCRPAE